MGLRPGRYPCREHHAERCRHQYDGKIAPKLFPMKIKGCLKQKWGKQHGMRRFERSGPFR